MHWPRPLLRSAQVAGLQGHQGMGTIVAAPQINRASNQPKKQTQAIAEARSLPSARPHAGRWAPAGCSQAASHSACGWVRVLCETLLGGQTQRESLWGWGQVSRPTAEEKCASDGRCRSRLGDSRVLLVSPSRFFLILSSHTDSQGQDSCRTRACEMVLGVAFSSRGKMFRHLYREFLTHCSLQLMSTRFPS